MRRTLGLAAALAACAPKAVVLGPPPTAPAAPAATHADRARTDTRRAALLARLGGPTSLNELLRPDDRGGPVLSGRALEAYAEGAELKAVQLARAALDADPGNAARRRMLDLLAPAAAPVPTPPVAPAAAPRTDRSRTDARRAALLSRLGDAAALSELLRADDLDGPLLAGTALEAYAEGSELKAVLFAQAALGADLGNSSRRKFLNILAVETGIPFDPEGVLPPAGLVQHELARAEAAFFERRFGAATQFCRRALLVSPKDARAWTRLGSTYYAVGDEARARQAYSQALTLDPNEPTLTRFMTERGWMP